MELVRPLYDRPTRAQIAEAYKWFYESGQVKRDGWADIRHHVWRYLGEQGLPPHTWDLPPAFMVAYLRIFRKATVKEALSKMTKSGYIKEEI